MWMQCGRRRGTRGLSRGHSVGCWWHFVISGGMIAYPHPQRSLETAGGRLHVTDTALESTVPCIVARRRGPCGVPQGLWHISCPSCLYEPHIWRQGFLWMVRRDEP